MKAILRRVWSQPGFAAVAVLTMALAIGAAAAVFSLVDAAVLRPLPFEQPEELVRLRSFNPKDKAPAGDVSYFDSEDYRSRNRSFTGLAAFIPLSNPLTGMGPARSVRMTFATPDLFKVLRVKPHLGRVFTRDEDIYGGPVLKAVISYSLWKDLFGGRPDVIGRTMQLRGQGYEVIGVLPAGFEFPRRSQVWVPLMARYSANVDDWWRRRDTRMHTVIARLAPGVSIEQANSDIAAIAGVLREEHPVQNLDAYAEVVSWRDAETGDARPYVRMAAAAGVLLLLLGCVNVANLMVARTLSRERDITVRVALGAGRWRLLRELLAETLLLSALAALLGTGIAHAAIRAFVYLLPTNIPDWLRLELDWRVLAFSVGAAILTAFLATLVPAVQQFGTNPAEVLKSSSRGSSQGRTFANLARRGLVIAEIALSAVLLAGAGLMVRSFQAAMSLDSGLKPEHIVVADAGRYVANVFKESAVRAYCNEYRRVQVALQNTPGVISASGGTQVPFFDSAEKRAVEELYTSRRSTREQAFRVPLEGADIMPGYFETLGIPLLEGRDFTENDTLASAPVMIISRRTARLLFPGENAIGQKIRYGINESYDPWSTVVGVVGDARYNAGERESGYEVYWPYRQFPGPGMRFVIRTAGDPAAMGAIVAKVIQQVNPEISISRTDSMKRMMAESIWQRRLWGAILSGFAVLALTLALVGLYGVMTYLVAQQRRDIGIRLAIGAPRASILTWVLGRGLALSVAGLFLGFCIAIPSGYLLGDLLFGIRPLDASVYLFSSAALSAAACAACLLPAIRATRVDPVIALRSE